MTTISATSVLASRHAVTGDRIDTFLLRYPRCIHSEFMTHRVFSRNASSSRAIPVEKLIKDVLDDPFVPLFWGKNQKGMQAGEECSEDVEFDYEEGDGHHTYDRRAAWLKARDHAVVMAKAFAAAGYHKQIVNRLLEPFAHITVVVTGTQWSNFNALRNHPDAEPHIRRLAQKICAAYNDAYVQTLQPGQWHMPFVHTSWRQIEGKAPEFDGYRAIDDENYSIWRITEEEALKLSVACCASTSYKTVEGFNMTPERAVALHDKLVASKPLHASPCEHQAKADGVSWENDPAPLRSRSLQAQNPHLGGNLGAGWIQYRKTLAGECL